MSKRLPGESMDDFMHRAHMEAHPDCSYGSEPHFVPPSFGQVGFYLCDVPDDLTNHSREGIPLDGQ